MDQCDMWQVLMLAVFAVALCGCASTSSDVSVRHAIVDDVTAPAPYVSGYAVSAVDGKAVRRASSPVATVIPMVIVEPGEHTLTIGGSTVTAVFEAGKGYRVKSENGEMSVMEKDD